MGGAQWGGGGWGGGGAQSSWCPWRAHRPWRARDHKGVPCEEGERPEEQSLGQADGRSPAGTHDRFYDRFMQFMVKLAVTNVTN